MNNEHAYVLRALGPPRGENGIRPPLFQPQSQSEKTVAYYELALELHLRDAHVLKHLEGNDIGWCHGHSCGLGWSSILAMAETPEKKALLKLLRSPNLIVTKLTDWHAAQMKAQRLRYMTATHAQIKSLVQDLKKARREYRELSKEFPEQAERLGPLTSR